MKKVLSIFLMLMCVSVGASAYDFMIDGLCYSIENYHFGEGEGKCVAVTMERTYEYGPYPEIYYRSSYVNIPEEVIIPEFVTYNGKTYEVKTIDSDAFALCSNLKKVTLPNTITTLGSYAFRGCTGLVSISLPQSVVRYYSYAFEGCSSLTSITLPDFSVHITGTGSYYDQFRMGDILHGCDNLRELRVPKSCKQFITTEFLPEGVRLIYY